MGTAIDKRRRQTMARTDSEHRVRVVESAREFIYEQGYTVNSDKVDKLLGDESLVPTRVFYLSFLRTHDLTSAEECFLNKSAESWLLFLHHVSGGPHARI